ncbi:response regulator transcription factor [Flavobacterium sp. J372]|uniref:response regulator transcription factor n=1 Tax=Flavobacterium sp. J372 TaxID=2898436 RepID=UPI0021515C94|nr:response regulator transcription factor [Flavobacterium sp. J372]MCR5861611.1 response regulator transcription factor [Flavobacterium sp. J372]
MEKIKLAITDDDNLIVGLLQGYLQSIGNLDVIFTAGGGHELLDKLSASDTLPDVLLLDLRMDGMDGIEVSEKLKINYPSIKIIVVSSHYQTSFMGFMLKTGVAAFLPKGISPADLLDVIKTVYAQGYYFRDDQLAALRGQITGKAPKPALHEEEMLTDREIEVLKLICQQKTGKEIADILNMSPRTADGHRNTLFVKTGAKNIAGLVIYALQQQIVHIDELPVM